MTVKKRYFGLTVIAGILVGLTRPTASLLPTYKFTPPAAWQKADMNSVDGAWMLRESPTKASLTITAESTTDSFDPKEFDEDKLVKDLELLRGMGLRIFGITNWKVHDHRLISYKKGFAVELVGSYAAPSGTPVRFVERDYFVGSNFYTVSFIEDANGQALQSDVSVQKLLDSFSAEGMVGG